MEWFGLNVETLTQLIINHLFLAELAVFFTGFSESLAILGMVMPGAILMPIIGFFIGSSIISWRLTLLVVTAGALTGDFISYFLGRKLQNRIDRIWPFTRWPQLLIQGRKFFDLHGGKGIIICGFIGPMRAIVPMTVGACNFPLWRFSLAAVPAAVAWAIVYMLPGILFGALAVELPAKLLGKLLLEALIVLLHFFKFTCYLASIGLVVLALISVKEGDKKVMSLGIISWGMALIVRLINLPNDFVYYGALIVKFVVIVISVKAIAVENNR